MFFICFCYLHKAIWKKFESTVALKFFQRVNLLTYFLVVVNKKNVALVCKMILFIIFPSNKRDGVIYISVGTRMQ